MYLYRLVIFRMDVNLGWHYREMLSGRLRQGWGSCSLSLVRAVGKPVNREDWNEAYEKDYGKAPLPQRFAILSRMLEVREGDLVLVPKMPDKDHFSIARVCAPYYFQSNLMDYGHIVPVYPESVRTFEYDAIDYIRPHLGRHTEAVSFCGSSCEEGGLIRDCHRLLGRS